jgi:NDP-sugar pyrophosphorylase family protein
MPVGEFPILEVIIRQLAQAGVRRVMLAVNHQAEIIRSYFNGGDKWGIDICYSLEKKPLGTMGPLKLMEKSLPDNFYVLNGDVLTDLDFRAFHNRHVNDGALFTIGAYRRTVRSEFGVLKVDGADNLIGFEEKPINEYLVSMGVYMVSRRVLDYIPSGTGFGFDDLMLGLLAAGKKVDTFRHDGLWLDIGRPDDYMQAIDLFEEEKARLLPEQLRLVS